MKTAHLLLGLSRQEVQRRVNSGKLDPLLLKGQIDKNAHELKLETRCEKWIELNSLEQADKFSEVD